VRVHGYVYACVCVYMYMYMHMPVHVRICVHVCMYGCVCICDISMKYFSPFCVVMIRTKKITSTNILRSTHSFIQSFIPHLVLLHAHMYVCFCLCICVCMDVHV